MFSFQNLFRVYIINKILNIEVLILRLIVLGGNPIIIIAVIYKLVFGPYNKKWEVNGTSNSFLIFLKSSYCSMLNCNVFQKLKKINFIFIYFKQKSYHTKGY